MCLCVCMYLWGLQDPQSEDIFGKRGHFNQSSLPLRTNWGLRLGFKYRLRLGVRGLISALLHNNSIQFKRLYWHESFKNNVAKASYNNVSLTFWIFIDNTRCFVHPHWYKWVEKKIINASQYNAIQFNRPGTTASKLTIKLHQHTLKPFQQKLNIKC